MLDIVACVAGHWGCAALLTPARYGGYLVIQPGGAVAWAGAIRAASDPDEPDEPDWWDELPDDAPGHDDPVHGPQVVL